MWPPPQSKDRTFPWPWSFLITSAADRLPYPAGVSHHWSPFCHYSSAFPTISSDRIMQYFVIFIWFLWLRVIFLRFLHAQCCSERTHESRSVKLCYHFLWVKLRSQTAGSYEKCKFPFIRDFNIVFQTGCSIWPSHWRHARGLIFLYWQSSECRHSCGCTTVFHHGCRFF